MERLKKIDELRRTLNDLRERGLTLKKSFSAFEKIIGAEKFVSAGLMTAVSEEFVGWMNDASKCFDLYEGLFGKQPPESFSELEKILDAEEKKIIVETVFERAEQFLFLTTEFPKLKKSLTAYQKKLWTRLSKKIRDKKLTAAVEPYANFMDAFKEKNIGKKFSASNELRGTFSDDFLGAGLFGDGVLTLSEQKVSFPTDKLKIDESPVVEKFVEKSADVDEKISADNSAVAKPAVDFAKIIREKDALLTADDFTSWEKKFKLENRLRNKKFTLKQVQKILTDSLGQEKIFLLSVILSNGSFSDTIKRDDNGFSAERLQHALENLFDKGLVQKYSFDDLGGFYTLSKEFFKFIQKNVEQLDMVFLTKIPNELNEYTAATAFSMVALYHLLCIKLDYMLTMPYPKVFSRAFLADFRDNDGRDLLIGNFWRTDDDYGLFFDELKNFSALENINHVIIVGLNVEHANKNLDAFEEILKLDFPKAARYIYSLADNAFYRRGTKKKVSPEKIWSKNPDAPHVAESPVVEKFVEKSADVDEKISADNSAVAKPAVDFAKIIREKDALLTADDFTSWEKIFEIKRGNQREITAKRLKKDFSETFLKAEKSHALIQAVFDEYISIPMLCEQINLSVTDIKNAMDFLVAKGYLQEYSFGEFGNFYGLTKEFYDFLKVGNAKDFFKFFSRILKKPSKLVCLQREYLSITAAKEALPRVFFSKLHVMENERRECSCGVTFFMQSVQGRFSGNSGADLIIACLWDNLDESQNFFDGLKKNLEREKNFRRVIVAGLNMQHAEKFFDALEEALGHEFLKHAEEFIYSFTDDAFYRRDLATKILPDEIWHKRSDGPDDEPPVPKLEVKKIPSTKTSSAKTSVVKNSVAITAPKNSIAETPDKKNSDAHLKDDESDVPLQPAPQVDENSDVPAAPETNDETVPLVKTSGKKSSAKKTSATKPTEVQTPVDKISDMMPLDEMLAAKKFYCATAYLKALSLQDTTYTTIYQQLAFAVNDPMLSINYGANKIISLVNESETPDEIFLTAATLRTFFYSHKQFDYDMKNLHGIVKNFELVEKNSPLADLIFELMNFKDKARNGADFYADYRVKNRQQAETKIAVLRREAQTCLDRIKNFNDKAFNPRFIETKKLLFGDDSELAKFLEHTAEDLFDEGLLTNMTLYLTEKFMRDDAPLSVENIDNFKMDEIIAEAWETAGENIRRKKHTLLVGELKNNVITSFKKAIEILCERIKIFEEVSPLHSDTGAAEYQKIRAKLIERARSARKILSQEKIPAVTVLTATLQEIIDKLEGTFEPVRQKYFYMDFLRGTEVLLDENYFPILNFNTLDGTSNGVDERIIAHARADLPTFEERIKNIFERGGWDFGSAQLIDAYLEERDGRSFIEESKYKLQDSIYAVTRIAVNERKKFFGFLELAQSYGQFDAAPENTKEKILKLIDRCFEFTTKSSNFGVFLRIRLFWKDKTRKDAAQYATLVESALERGIKNYCRKTDELPTSSDLQNSVAQIRKMIDRRNYTVAQGLINRLSDGKLCLGTEPSTTQTDLQRFIEDYENYYNRVRKSGESFKTLVGKNHRFRADTSKGIKGGEILIDNWIPNGFPQNGDIGEDKIERLLTALGFKVESVKRSGAIKKDALNYKVKLLKPSNGRASNYNHPISAFGSKAEINGFRVTCLFGTYNADGLIERFKQLGNAENTLVLLDYALELPERRILARKIKAESGITKTFAVVDRVIMMYLVKNYDELQINKILMSLAMPFAACQPYVFNPNVPIPPEIFIGREKEMRRVLDFDDANLVYGGRQLGKTALLKMACASLDRNENNDRAIFVDVNKCNCADAALKICQKLREENFFDETFADVSDWGELAAAIKKRLASDTPNKIPRFMLALDEADDFIKSCREVDFKPILELIDVQQNFHNGSRFKFVMAGLRDVVRFYRDDLLGNNNQIAKLPSLTVKPFELEDATKLLKEPLRCLGFYFPDNEMADSLAMMILETTNYFPGLIQLYCAKLIEALSKEDYAFYRETDSPIYEISESHVQSVLGEESFNEEIKNKVNMTLRLGDDKFYYVIAHLMAWRYHNDDSVEGYSAEDISDTAAGFGLENLLPQDVKQIEALLKEMCELNILRETDKGKYLFVRQRFLNMIGTSEEIEAEITSGFSEN